MAISSKVAGRGLDKGARFTDWSRRPLDKRQIDYAIGDVTYLIRIFPKMLEKLRKTGRGDWLDEEMERIADPASNYETSRGRMEAGQSPAASPMCSAA
jgi:ribonuclease D